MAEYWLISIPTEINPDTAFLKLNRALSSPTLLSSQCLFQMPMNLKVGTLDLLVGLSEDLNKLDTFAEGVGRKIAQYMGEILEEQRDKLVDNLTVGGETPGNYVTKFHWDSAKYPIKLTLPALFDILSEQVTRIESDLRTKSMGFNNIKSNLQSMERKQTGSLFTRNIAELVTKDQFVLNSDYLVTLVVVVPKHLYGEWKTKYESFSEFTVPRSSELVYEDHENGLWTVTVFRKMAQDFCTRAREYRFISRDFAYDEKSIEESKNALSKLESEKKRLFPPLFRWLKINFGENFSAMLHIKALRVFVESVLRYGLPVNFQAILIKPNKKYIKRVRDLLYNLYGHMDNLAAGKIKDEEINVPGMSTGDYYPYVCINLETNMMEL